MALIYNIGIVFSLEFRAMLPALYGLHYPIGRYPSQEQRLCNEKKRQHHGHLFFYSLIISSRRASQASSSISITK